MSNPILALKIDVDTERGTRIGVPNLLELFKALELPATFLFSLGPDNTGRAIKRVFRPGFLKKVSRTSIISTYGLRTLLNGTLLPGPHIGKRHANIMQAAREQGHETGIHSYDHCYWQDHVQRMTAAQVSTEFGKALQEFQRIFAAPARAAGTAGWQANAYSLAAYDQAGLRYGSDGRGTQPFFPKIGATTFKTLQIPTTLPTLDELLGRPEYPQEQLTAYYLSRVTSDQPNILTLHAEVEGMRHLGWFKAFLQQAKAQGVIFQTLEQIADTCLAQAEHIPICAFTQGTIDGRSGTLALQGERV